MWPLGTNPGLFVWGCGDVHGARALRLEVEHVEGFRVARVPHLPFAHLRGHAWDELRLRAYDGIYVGERARVALYMKSLHPGVLWSVVLYMSWNTPHRQANLPN